MPVARGATGSQSSGSTDQRSTRRVSMERTKTRFSQEAPAPVPLTDPLTYGEARAVPEELMSPEWRQIKRCLVKVAKGLEAADEPVTEDGTIGDDHLNFLDMGHELRRDLLARSNKKLLTLVEEFNKHNSKSGNLLGNLDKWLGDAAYKLETDDDDADGESTNAFGAAAGARPNANVGTLLNHQSEMGVQIQSVHGKMTAMVQQVRRVARGGARLAHARLCTLAPVHTRRVWHTRGCAHT